MFYLAMISYYIQEKQQQMMEICWEGQHEKNRYIWYTKGVSVLPLTAHNIKNVNNNKQKLF